MNALLTIEAMFTERLSFQKCFLNVLERKKKNQEKKEVQKSKKNQIEFFNIRDFHYS